MRCIICSLDKLHAFKTVNTVGHGGAVVTLAVLESSCQKSHGSFAEVAFHGPEDEAISTSVM